jgi:hypothetical protein
MNQKHAEMVMHPDGFGCGVGGRLDVGVLAC